MASLTLKSVDPMSYGKIEAVLSAIIGLVYGIFAAFAIGSFALIGGSAMGISGGLAVAMPFVGIIGGAVFGFIVGAISAIVYNFLAGIVGGIRIDIGSNPTVINSINGMSLAKMAAIVAFILSVIVAIVLVAALPIIVGAIGNMGATGSANSSMLLSELQGISGTVQDVILVIIPIVGIIGGFIYGLIYAAVYGFLARQIGGIKFTLSGKPSAITAVDPMSYAKMSASIAAVIAFITSIFNLLIHQSLASAIGVIGIPILDFVIGFVVTYIFAMVYNWIAPRIGGIKVVLQ